MANIFISYRRDDTTSDARLLWQNLDESLSQAEVVWDIEAIPGGDNFRDRVYQAIERCDVCLALIGPKWLDVEKLNEPDDWVRVEIESALAQDKRIIPILVNGTNMPQPDFLPHSLQEFAYKNALPLNTGSDFEAHVEKIAESINRSSSRRKSQKKRLFMTTFFDGERVHCFRTESGSKYRKTSADPGPTGNVDFRKMQNALGKIIAAVYCTTPEYVKLGDLTIDDPSEYICSVLILHSDLKNQNIIFKIDIDERELKISTFKDGKYLDPELINEINWNEEKIQEGLYDYLEATVGRLGSRDILISGLDNKFYTDGSGSVAMPFIIQSPS